VRNHRKRLSISCKVSEVRDRARWVEMQMWSQCKKEQETHPQTEGGLLENTLAIHAHIFKILQSGFTYLVKVVLLGHQGFLLKCLVSVGATRNSFWSMAGRVQIH